MIVYPEKLEDFARKLEMEKTKLMEIQNNITTQIDRVNTAVAHSTGFLTDRSHQDIFHQSVAKIKQNMDDLSRLQKKLMAEAKDFKEADSFEINWQSALLPLAMVGTAHYTGLLRIESSRKGNHYIFKYNRSVAHFLKGKSGPLWWKKWIQGQNRNAKQKGTRLFHEKIKGGVFDGTGNNMVLKKSELPWKMAKVGFWGVLTTGVYQSYTNIGNKINENEKLYTGEDLDDMNARVIGEEVNKTSGAAIGAGIGAFVGTVFGGLLGPPGAVIGGIVLGVVGEAVGSWDSKYTKEWAGNLAVKVENKIDQVVNTAKNVYKDAKETFTGVKNTLFGWI